MGKGRGTRKKNARVSHSRVQTGVQANLLENCLFHVEQTIFLFDLFYKIDSIFGAKQKIIFTLRICISEENFLPTV